MQINQAAMPAAVISELNRAAHSAAIVLKHEHGLTVSRRVLREHGAAVVVEQAALSGGHHPSTPAALGFLHDVLCELMVERAH